MNNQFGHSHLLWRTNRVRLKIDDWVAQALSLAVWRSSQQCLVQSGQRSE
jgi:hypothetical protein